MLRFCGVFASDHRHLKCAVAATCQGGKVGDRPKGRVGVGYYSGDEVLLMRRPVGAESGIVQMIGPAIGNHVLFGIDDSQTAQFRLESTSPFRFRNYLGLVSVGQIKQKDFAERLLFHVPEYLARDARSDLPSELLFLLYLSYVHDLGRIEAPRIAPGMLMDALRSTLMLVPKLLDGSPPPLALCVGNGRHMVAAAIGTDLWMRSFDGIDPCPLCSEPERTVDRDSRFVRHRDVRVVAFAHHDGIAPAQGFAKLPPGQVVAATSTGEIISRSV